MPCRGRPEEGSVHQVLMEGGLSGSACFAAQRPSPWDTAFAAEPIDFVNIVARVVFVGKRK
jgi:hypothetical protein